MNGSAIGGMLGCAIATCLGAAVAQATPLHVIEDWLPLASDVSVGDRPVLAGPDAPNFNNAIFYSALNTKVLHEIDGEDSSRLTYIFRLWNYRLGMKKRLDGTEDYAEPDLTRPPSIPAADLIDPAVDPAIPGAPSLPAASIDFATIPPPQSPIPAVPEPSTILLGAIAVAGSLLVLPTRALAA